MLVSLFFTAYISNRRLLLSLADAGGRLMYAYKDLLELAGLTTRLYTLISTLHNLPKTPEREVSSDGSFEIRNVDVLIPASSESILSLRIGCDRRCTYPTPQQPCNMWLINFSFHSRRNTPR